MRHAMIMAGGSGTRLWPLSRRNRPKQLLPLVGGQSLLQLAAKRLDGVVAGENRWICTGERFRAAVREAILWRDDRIIGEPVGRDTLNAVGLSAAVIAKVDPGAVMAVLTADHVIEPVERFAAAIRTGFEIVERDPKTLATFSIKPDRTATEYGYIERGEAVAGFEGRGAWRVKRYVEKPNAETAAKYVAAGVFGWSAGMFVFNCGAILDAIGQFVPAARKGLDEIAVAWGTSRQGEVLARVYPGLPKTSIDYGVMEPVTKIGSGGGGSADDGARAGWRVATVDMEVSWVDVGSWPALARTVAGDGEGNRVIGGGGGGGGGGAKLAGCRNVLAVSDDAKHLIAAIGCEDLVIVHTADATLVSRMDRAEEVKRVVEGLEEGKR